MAALPKFRLIAVARDNTVESAATSRCDPSGRVIDISDIIDSLRVSPIAHRVILRVSEAKVPIDLGHGRLWRS